MPCQALCIISKPSVNSNCSYSPETHNSDQNQQFFVPCDLEIWVMTLKNNSHLWIQTGVTVRKCHILVKMAIFCPKWSWNLTDDLEKPLLYYFKLCAPFHSHWWIQTGVTVRILPKLGQNLFWPLWPWPWPFAWSSLLSMVITHKNFIVIQWEEHCENGVTDGRTDRWIDGQTELFLVLLGCR